MRFLKYVVAAALVVMAGYGVADGRIVQPIAPAQHLAVSSSVGTSAPITAARLETIRIVANVDVWVAVSGPFTTTANSNAVFIPASAVTYLRATPDSGSGLTDGRRTVIFVSQDAGEIHIQEVEVQ